jgi:hypothetical protein
MDHFPDDTESPVQYFPVTMGDEVVGYIWAAETDDAAGFVRRLAAERHDTFDAAVHWDELLQEAYTAGLPPLQALQSWVGQPPDPEGGGIAADAVRQRAASLRALGNIANPGYEEQVLRFPDGTPMDRGQRWEDLSPVATDQNRYKMSTDGPVRYLRVTRGGEVLGFLWASETDDAAAFVARKGSGAAGFDAGGFWSGRLNRANAEGLTPLQAIRRWVGAPEDPEAGGIAADAQERELPSWWALRTLDPSASEQGEP